MRIVVKVGTGVLTQEHNGQLDGSSIIHLVTALADLIQQGHSVILVSSGAVGAGVSTLQLTEYPQTLPLKQACASVGQAKLIHTYDNLFRHFNIAVAQLLLTADDLKHRKTNVEATLRQLDTQRNIIPIINENDTVSVQELKFGDNDILSMHMAKLIKADKLFILTSVDGLYADPNTKTEIIKTVSDVQSVMGSASDSKGKFAMGGMGSKLQAIQQAVEAGIDTYMIHGRKPERIADWLDNNQNAIGTHFIAKV